MSGFFEITAKYRVVDKLSGKPIRGRQGTWKYAEPVYLLAADEWRARQLLENKINNQIVRGVRRVRRGGLRRQIVINEIKEL